MLTTFSGQGMMWH